jgi:hypothetical protein
MSWMTICPHTGVSRPECSCRACLQAQIEEHQPALLSTGTALAEIPPAGVLAEAIPPAKPDTLAKLPRFALRERLRRLRRAA